METATAEATQAQPTGSETKSQGAANGNDEVDTGGTKESVQSMSGDNKQSASDKPEDSKQDAEKKYKINVYGKEYNLTEKEIVTWAQKAKAAETQFQETATLKKQVAELIETLRNDPRQVLSKVLKPEQLAKLAESVLVEKYKLEDMPEAERKALELENKVKQYETEKEQMHREREEALMQQEVQKLQQEYDKNISESLSKSSVPKTVETVSRVAHYLFMDNEQREKNPDIKRAPLSIDEAVMLVDEDYKNHIKHLAISYSPQQIVEILGNEFVDKIAAESVKRLQGGKQTAQFQKQSDTPLSKKPARRIPVSQLSQYLDDMVGA